MFHHSLILPWNSPPPALSPLYLWPSVSRQQIHGDGGRRRWIYIDGGQRRLAGSAAGGGRGPIQRAAQQHPAARRSAETRTTARASACRRRRIDGEEGAREREWVDGEWEVTEELELLFDFLPRRRAPDGDLGVPVCRHGGGHLHVARRGAVG